MPLTAGGCSRPLLPPFLPPKSLNTPDKVNADEVDPENDLWVSARYGLFRLAQNRTNTCPHRYRPRMHPPRRRPTSPDDKRLRDVTAVRACPARRPRQKTLGPPPSTTMKNRTPGYRMFDRFLPGDAGTCSPYCNYL